MKRYWTSVLCSLVLAAGAGAVYAASSSTITVDPSQMKEGETKTVTDDGRTITVRREGNATTIRIDNAGSTENVTITREGNRIRIGHLGENSSAFVIGPDRKRIIVDGVPLDGSNPRFRTLPGREMSTFYVCPKDHTTLRVPEAKEEQSFKCPLDGTVMEKKKGRGFTFFFDDSSFESNLL